MSQRVVDRAGESKVDAGLIARVVARFKAQQSSGAFPGGQLVVRRNGKLIVNEAIGLARGHRKDEGPAVQATPETLFPAYSCGKPLAAITIALLEDRGKLDPHAPIAEVFPEFARNGKAQITTLDVLTHRSGILLPHLVSKMECWGDREIITHHLVNATPVYRRGTLAYAPWEYGWILSEIVRRVDGRRLTDFFAEEIATPLNLPELRFGLGGRDPESIAHAYWLGKDKLMVAGVNVAHQFEETNNAKAYFESLNPAFTLISNAASLASFYDFMLRDGATISGEKLISGNVLRKYTTRNVFGFDRSLKTFLAVGRGFTLGTFSPSMFGWWNTGQCFGHGGVFSCLAGADYRTGMSIAILTNGNRSIINFTKRFIPLTHGIRHACFNVV
jgi:CubicO group peptidase (beta-lactamase class C family)